MTRLIPAAKQLISEVDGMGKPYKTVEGDPDGLGFIRDVTFDARTSKWLVPLLDAVDDERIASIHHPENKGRATIHFVTDTRADFSDPFEIAAVDKVFHEEEQPAEPDQ